MLLLITQEAFNGGKYLLVKEAKGKLFNKVSLEHSTQSLRRILSFGCN